MKSFTLITLTALAAVASAAPAQHEALAERQTFMPGPSPPRCGPCNPLGTTIKCGPGLRVTTFVSTTLLTIVSLNLTLYMRDGVHMYSSIQTLTWFV
ncbi:hypothetical protein COCSADRAFT_39449 [Bipolaris sorokiniana ND90Pr]|uniref:Hydrophobin n=1 Tax=Cochliobolus sativus (strain ND90Pr / ATCC 201652) TaxID=665912 RepID=M2SH57_COCSN|nr:uncharacterized protein COCSADRAFT_39449 [Bipolaris sorokiniana ND90Pr]EMD61745.1 hypothetical protein COCSADRAFT_39449 [Bipolaris sorokiniana ND90Pr]